MKGSFRCGFCSAGDHSRCPGAVHGGVCGVLVCTCCLSSERCLSCGSEADVAKWRCVRPDECKDRVSARKKTNPLWMQLQECIAAGRAAKAEARIARAPQMTFEFEEA